MIETDEIMKHCWFLCNSFHFKKISTIFDGELNMLKQVYLRIVSFLRKMSKNIQLENRIDPRDLIVGNLNGYLLEPVNPSYAVTNKYFFDEEIRKDLMGTANTMPKLNKYLI